MRRRSTGYGRCTDISSRAEAITSPAAACGLLRGRPVVPDGTGKSVVANQLAYPQGRTPIRGHHCEPFDTVGLRNVECRHMVTAYIEKSANISACELSPNWAFGEGGRSAHSQSRRDLGHRGLICRRISPPASRAVLACRWVPFSDSSCHALHHLTQIWGSMPFKLITTINLFL